RRVPARARLPQPRRPRRPRPVQLPAGGAAAGPRVTTTPTRPHALLPNGPSLPSLYAPPPTDPTLTVVPPVGHTVVELSGDLGGAATAALRERLLVALRHSEQLLVLDLSAVTGCDAAALAVLIGT